MPFSSAWVHHKTCLIRQTLNKSAFIEAGNLSLILNFETSDPL